MTAHQLQLLLTLLEWGIRILFWLSILFPFIMAPFWPWWRTWWSRNIIAFDYCVSLTIFPSWMNVTFGIKVSNSLGWGSVEVAGVYLVVLNILWRIGMVLYTQINGMRKERDAISGHERVPDRGEYPGNPEADACDNPAGGLRY